jgi:hypothetical protein
MDETLPARLKRAKDLLNTTRHAAMATVNEDGSPHNTPYFLMFDDDLGHFYWGSNPESLHSKNIARTGQAFVVIYDRTERGGLYVKIENAHAPKGDELEHALAVHNKHRAKEGKEPLLLQYFLDGPQRMYQGDAVQFWVNSAERDEKGLVIRDIRLEVKPSDILAA